MLLTGGGMCVPLDVQILTQRGWLTRDQLQNGDQTIGFNPATGHSEWTPVREVHVYDDVPLVRLSNKTWEATCTPYHRWSAAHWNRAPRAREPMERGADGRCSC